MSFNLRAGIFIVGLILLVVNYKNVKKDRMPFKYFLIWMVPTFTVLFLSIFPTFLNIFKNFLGFQVLSNMFVGVLFVLLFFICINLTVIVSDLTKKTTLLVQKVSLLQKELDDYKAANKKGE